MAGIRDVASKANVAPCTVSRVLNGTANIETKLYDSGYKLMLCSTNG